MRYSELIHFEPIESVIQLRRADKADEAKNLVRTFVISDRMAEQLTKLVFPELRFDEPHDNKGVLVVGNYGTGKSHLMAVLSALAEDASAAKLLTNEAVAEAAKPLAGKFKVLRAEINTRMSLRDFFCQTLDQKLEELGVDYSFPPEKQVLNPKDAFAEMMAAFHGKYPKQGLLFVLDELLDYLRSRKDLELIQDLNFLRAVGEFCSGSRFRFVGGVQESLFDSPIFHFAAESVRRVQARFEQIRIAREDVAFVVSQRLLKKDAKQEARIREHLLKFAPLYGSMNERMDEFVRLFPVHPAYLSTFESVRLAEKREVLKTLSAEIRKLVDQNVPADSPGLVAYDSYWKTLKDNPSFRAVDDIKKVVDKADVLEGRIQQSFTRPQYKSVALRIVQALAVHRLTTGDIYAKLGATAEELRDDLCLLLPLPEKEAEFLRSVVETVLKEILKTVSGQFLSFNKENGQYYLDLQKDVDFDSLIEKKAEGLSPDRLDHYYFEALSRVLECTDVTYRTGFRIWEHELEWLERRAGRSGYLFFGAPNERPNTTPPRDFYLYFVEPYDPVYFKDEKKADEVIFRLKSRPEGFEGPLKLYAGAREQAAAASGANKKIYEEKALEHLKALTSWLAANAAAQLEVTHQGRTKLLADVVRGKAPAGGDRSSFRDTANLAASLLLGPHFADRAPEYPTFTVLVTRANRAQAASDALKWIGGGAKTKQGTAVLDALELLDGDILRPRDSRYGKSVLEVLSKKAPNQVLNRNELIGEEGSIEYWFPFRLEPELLAVVLAALVHAGDVVISLPGKKLDASGLDALLKLPADELAAFKHLERPKDLPLGPLQELFDLLSLARGLIVNPGTREDGVQKLHVAAAQRIEQAVAALQSLDSGLAFWGRPVVPEKERTAWAAQIRDLKTFLESLQPFNTVGKLKNFPHDVPAVQARKVALATVESVSHLAALCQQLNPMTAYLQTAEAILPEGHPWVASVRAAKDDLVGRVVGTKGKVDSGLKRDVEVRLAELRADYQAAYLKLHGQARLGAEADKKKAALLKDSRLAQLQKLASIEILPAHQLQEVQNRLLGLKTCFSVAQPELDASPHCPHCGFRPAEEPASMAPGGVLGEIDEKLDKLVHDWTVTLLDNLSDPIVAGNLELLTDVTGKQALQAFLRKKVLAEPVDQHLVKALQEVLSGLQRVALKRDVLFAALGRGGAPSTIADLKERLEELLSEACRGKDLSKVRLVLE